MDAKDYLVQLETRTNTSGFTIAEVCRKAGVQQSLVSRWKGGKHEPRLSSLKRLEKALDELIAERQPAALEDLL